VRRIAQYHPAWPAISFINTLNCEYACKLLNEIVDPRWFIHPRRPERLSRLYSYLGLTPANVHAILRSGAGDRYIERANIAVKSWYDPSVAINDDPRGFLGRTSVGAKDQVVGVLRATQRFVALAATYWLGVVTKAHPEAGFQASLFFHEAEEVSAFEHHKSRAKKV
jgi:hypothetical protein